MRERWYNIIIVCQQCGGHHEVSRYDAKFCSSKCRAKFHRVQKKRTQNIERIRELMSVVLKEAETAEAWESALDDIQGAIDRARIDCI